MTATPSPDAGVGFINGVVLQRIVGVPALALLIVSVTVGAGIFGMPALAARDPAASLPWRWSQLPVPWRCT